MHKSLIIASTLALSVGVASAQTTTPTTPATTTPAQTTPATTSTTTAAPTQVTTFSDVPAGHWAKDAVDVIVIARGGGAFEDLLSFSDESVLRAVFAAHTPVVSAIGHENDQPLLDYVADLRASTPTDAGKRIVPDVHDERLRIAQARGEPRPEAAGPGSPPPGSERGGRDE